MYFHSITNNNNNNIYNFMMDYGLPGFHLKQELRKQIQKPEEMTGGF